MQQNVSICKMVTVYTQYRKHFKGPRWDELAISEYNRKKDYCIGRRSVEHRHQPLEWDSYESENSNDVDEYETRRDASRQAEISSEMRTRKRDKTNKTFAAKPVKQAWEAEKNAHERFNKETATQTTHRTHSKHRRSKRKKNGKSVDERKGLVGGREQANERVPFLSYGWANDAPVEKKYTHNVRAHPKDVSQFAIKCNIVACGFDFSIIEAR